MDEFQDGALTVSQGSGLRLVHVVLSLDPGGTERLVIEMTRLLKRQAEIKVICLDGPGEWSAEMSQLGVTVEALNRLPGFRPSLAGRIASIAKGHGAAVLHCHHYSPFVYGALAGMLRPGLRVVYTEHGRVTDEPPTAKRKLANLFFANLPGKFVAVSQDLRSHMLAEGFSSSRVKVIHNGIDLEDSPTDEHRLEARHILGLKPSTLTIGTVARLDPVMDLATLIRAFSRLGEDFDDLVLIVVGDGPELSGLQSLAIDEGVKGRVKFLGHRDDVRQLLPAFDVFTNSSLTEGVSVTILEAMAAGVPVVATAVGGTPEVVEDGLTGSLVPKGDDGQLADALRSLGRDSNHARELGLRGRQRVERYFSLDRMVSQYLQMYQGAKSVPL